MRRATNETSIYFYVLKRVKRECKKNFTHEMLCIHWDISRPKLSAFLNEKNIDWRLLFLFLEWHNVAFHELFNHTFDDN